MTEEGDAGEGGGLFLEIEEVRVTGAEDLGGKIVFGVGSVDIDQTRGVAVRERAEEDRVDEPTRKRLDALAEELRRINESRRAEG